jgi:hypothetical protein
VTFARDAPNHQHTHPHETRPCQADKVDKTPYLGISGKEDILIKNKERLDSANVPVCIFDGEVLVFKSFKDRVLDDLVIAMILSLAFESA